MGLLPGASLITQAPASLSVLMPHLGFHSWHPLVSGLYPGNELQHRLSVLPGNLCLLSHLPLPCIHMAPDWNHSSPTSMACNMCLTSCSCLLLICLCTIFCLFFTTFLQVDLTDLYLYCTLPLLTTSLPAAWMFSCPFFWPRVIPLQQRHQSPYALWTSLSFGITGTLVLPMFCYCSTGQRM